MVAKKLRAVGPDEVVPVPKPIPSLEEAVALGDPLTILLAQRRDIARDLPGEKGPAKAALHRQMTLISKESDAVNTAAARVAEEEAGDGRIEDEAWDEEAL